MSGNVLINERGVGVNSYNVWNYAEGNDSYYRSMLVDVTQPSDKVGELCELQMSSCKGSCSLQFGRNQWRSKGHKSRHNVKV